MSRGRAVIAGLASVVALSPLALACSAYSPSGFARNDAGADGALAVASDAAGADAHFADGAIPAAPDAGGAEDNRADPGVYAATCLDGIGLDCANPSCAQAASCCVGVSSSVCCTIAAAPIDLMFACATGTCDTLTRFTTFGDVGPVRTSDGAFAPESDHGTDSGAILSDAVDPRASMLTITASLAVPAHTLDVDAIGVGLVAGGPTAHVVPLAAVVVSAARRQILLLLGETIAGVLTAPTDDAMHDYELTIDPRGTVRVTVGTNTLSATVALPSTPLRVAFFGRATNPSASTSGLPARIGALHVSSRGCDQPTALTRMGPITIVDHTGAALLSSATDPSVASDGTDVFLAFSAPVMSDPSHSAIFIGMREADGAFHVRAPATGTQPVLAPTPGDALESPALVNDAGTWSLFATRVHADVRSIVHARGTSMHALSFGSPLDVVTPDLAGDVSSPAPIPNDPTRLVARYVPGGASSAASAELVVLLLAASGATATPSAGLCGADSTCANGARSQAHLYASRAASIAFDADDVDDPAIVLYDHVYRLYYAGRLGARWSIGMLVAADLGYWRPANGGAPVLVPEGVGFDAVSVRSPAPLVEGQRLALYFVGSDGDTSSFGLAQGGITAP